MKKFDKADKVFFVFCGLLFILSFSFLCFTPLNAEQSGMLALLIVSCIALIVCLIWKKKRSNLKNNETCNTKNTNT